MVLVGAVVVARVVAVVMVPGEDDPDEPDSFEPRIELDEPEPNPLPLISVVVAVCRMAKVARATRESSILDPVPGSLLHCAEKSD